MVSKTQSKKSSEPTMAELLAASSTKVKSYSMGDKVVGKILAINPRSLILDIGGKSEGIVAEKAFIEARDFIKTLKVGDELTATVLVPETREGNVALSLRKASYDSIWEKLEKAKETGEPISVSGKGVNPSGIMVEVEGISGFIPGSQLGKELSEDPEEVVGTNFKAIVLEVDRSSNKLVLSEKAVSEAEDIKLAKEVLDTVKEGEIYDGVVTTVLDFGCFVRLDLDKLPTKTKKTSFVEGLVHISELSWSKIVNPANFVKVGDKVKVKVIGLRDGKLSLSIKQAKVDPWDKVAEKYKKEMKVEGKVTKVSDFGVFVELEPGIEGLVHITKIPPAMKLKVGDKVNCYIEEIDTEDKKLSLGLVLTSKPIGYK